MFALFVRELEGDVRQKAESTAVGEFLAVLLLLIDDDKSSDGSSLVCLCFWSLFPTLRSEESQRTGDSEGSHVDPLDRILVLRGRSRSIIRTIK
ncbi:hypothetical protein L1887_11640 [Cichorium endivia]|nr:hypothetical protein L1887_11640 [Cichorium endivia]